VQVIAAKPAAATRRADADEYAGYGGYSGGYGGGYGGGSGAAPGVGAGMGYGGAVATYGSAYDLPNNAAAPPPVYAPPAAAPVAAPAGGGGSGAAAASASAATAAAAGGKALNDKQKRKLKVLRTGAGEKWMDPTMNEWPDSTRVVVPCCVAVHTRRPSVDACPCRGGAASLVVALTCG
jgi:hypothetical protein